MNKEKEYSLLDRNLTIKEIEEISIKKTNYKKIFLIIIFILLPLIFLSLIGLGIYLIIDNEDNLPGGVILITFSTMFFITSLLLPLMFKKEKVINKKLFDKLFYQALKEGLSSQITYEAKPLIDKKFLNETNVSPLLINNSKDKIIFTLDKVKSAIFDIESVDPLKESGATLIGSVFELGALAPLGILAVSVDMIKNKETINRKFNGLIFVTSSINKVIENTVEIRSKKENSPDTYLYSSKDKVETESMLFNKYFNAYGKKEDVFYVLTPRIIDGLIKLDKEIKGGISLIFKDNNLIKGFNGYHLDLSLINKNRKKYTYLEYYNLIKDKVSNFSKIIHYFGLEYLSFKPHKYEQKNSLFNEEH